MRRRKSERVEGEKREERRGEESRNQTLVMHVLPRSKGSINDELNGI